jgi:Osmosensitive K+ channel histidine kinase
MEKASYSQKIRYLNKTYILIFISIFISIIYAINKNKDFLLICLIIGLGISVLSYFQLIKQYIQNELKVLSEVIDDAIDGKKIQASNDETERSLLTTKLSRFAKVRNMEINSIKQNKKRVEALIADISHQTKTPISNVVLYSNLIIENITNQEKVSIYATNLNNQSEKLKWLIEELIHMSRLENSIIQCNVKHYRVDELIFKSINHVYSKAIEKNIEIKYTSNTMKAYFDIKWTSEAVANILDNAIKYSLEKGVIEIDVIKYEQFLSIQIKDQGIGISEEEFPHIFKRFYRSEKVSTQDGLGIGLYLSRKILSTQNGYIKVESKQKEGAIFQVYLPLDRKY